MYEYLNKFSNSLGISILELMIIVYFLVLLLYRKEIRNFKKLPNSNEKVKVVSIILGFLIFVLVYIFSK